MESSSQPAALPRSVEWHGGLDGDLVMIDQTLLPTQLRVMSCPNTLPSTLLGHKRAA